MSKVRQKIIISILFFALGFIITSQIQNVKEATGQDSLLTTKAHQLRMELEALAQAKSEIQKELKQLDNEINMFVENESEENNQVKLLQEELTKYQILTGSRSLEGSGIIITIEEPAIDNDDDFLYESDLLIHYIDILGIINKLNISGAEGIAINDIRYLSSTEISTYTDKLIINGVPINFPIYIAAIGDPELLENAMNIPYGLIDEVNRFSPLKASTIKEAKIIIPRSTKVQSLKYAKPIEVN